jgi:hypothetical protein
VDRPLISCLPACLPACPFPTFPPPPQVQAFDGPGNGDPMLITSSTPGNDAAGTTASASANATGPATEKGAAKGGAATSAGKAPTAEKGSAPAPGSASGSGCSDVPTPDSNSCKQQKGEHGLLLALLDGLHCLEGLHLSTPNASQYLRQRRACPTHTTDSLPLLLP